MVECKLYVEGGGESHNLHIQCRKGFHDFLLAAGFAGRMPRIVACGSRQKAFESFSNACKTGQFALLLVDSEDPVTVDSPWVHLANRQGDQMPPPDGATDDHCHFMVTCMESWFLADREKLCSFFGQGFSVSTLPQNVNIETVNRRDLLISLQKASADCKTKAPYGKGEHSFKILSLLNPDKVRHASPWADRFLTTLDTQMQSPK